jgi:predicted ArsR family transcriptional regulator
MATDKLFWESTRGRVLLLLRRGSRTVSELAESIGITTSAVRMHLDRLVRDGFVRQSGKRRGTRKPTTTYDLTPEAERFFPKAHAAVLHHLLDVLKERMRAKTLEDVVRAVGHRLAPSYRPAVRAGKPVAMGEQVVAILRELGGFCESDMQSGKNMIRCFDCPLAPVVEAHPEVCKMVETLLSDALGVNVEQRCQARPSPQCVFLVDGSAE